MLFVCNFNAVRSACAEALARHYFGKSVYVQSAGVRGGEPTDPFMIAALDEIGIDARRATAPAPWRSWRSGRG